LKEKDPIKKLQRKAEDYGERKTGSAEFKDKLHSLKRPTSEKKAP